jgi:hypothetical protein
MKKYIFLLAIGLTASVAQSQEISDAMRYSQDNLNGTARFRAMSGAFGALGAGSSLAAVNAALTQNSTDRAAWEHAGNIPWRCAKRDRSSECIDARI